MWCYPESWLDGGVLGRTSPFRQMRVVPQMRRYHAKLKFVVRRASDTTLGEFRVDGLYLNVLPIDEIIR